MNDKWFTNWSIVHILLYILIALFIPNNWWFAIIISIMWELYEYIMSKIYNNDFYAEVIINRVCDIIFNLIGYYIGSVIFSLIN
jgi:hypothetical protein